MLENRRKDQIKLKENERLSNTYTLKNMSTGEQQQLPIEEITRMLQ